MGPGMTNQNMLRTVFENNLKFPTVDDLNNKP